MLRIEFPYVCVLQYMIALALLTYKFINYKFEVNLFMHFAISIVMNYIKII